MNTELNELIDGLGYNSKAMQDDNVPVADYKELLQANGYNVDAMEADGLFKTAEETPQEPIIDLGVQEGSPEIITEVPGTVIPEDNQATMTLPEVEASEQQGQDNIDAPMQVLAGMRQSVTLPLAKVLEDSLNKVGINVGTESSENLSKVNKYIENYNEKHPDQVIHPATIGNIASQLVVPAAKSVKAVAATEAILNALDGIGKREDYDDVILDASIGAAFGATSMALFNRLTRNVGPLSYEAKLLIDKHPELNEADVLKALDGVPKADQAYALSNMVEDDFVDFAAKAVKPDNRDKLLLKQQLAGRTKIIQETIGDVDKQVDEAKTLYSDMINEVAKDAHNTFTFEGMIPKLDSLIKRYDKTPSKALQIVNNMRADLEAGKGTMNVRTALQFRQDLNYLLNKANRYEEKELIKSMKGGVDKFLENNLDNQTLSMVDNAITNYSRAMNNADFIDVMSKFTKKKSTDWVGLKKALKKEKLSSPEVDNAIEIVQEFSEKFKNDKQLRTAVKTKGQAEDPGGMLSILSYAINATRDTLIPFGKRHRELKIQDAILKSIRKAKDPIEAFRFMKVNKVPPKLVKDLQKSLLIEYKPEMAPSGDVNLQKKFVSPSGTVGEDLTTVSMHDAQTELLQKALKDDYTQQVDDKIKAELDSVRFNKILTNVRNRIKSDSEAANTKMIANIVKTEANVLIREIEKDLGIKLPTSEAKKIIQLKLDEIK